MSFEKWPVASLLLWEPQWATWEAGIQPFVVGNAFHLESHDVYCVCVCVMYTEGIICVYVYIICVYV